MQPASSPHTKERASMPSWRTAGAKASSSAFRTGLRFKRSGSGVTGHAAGSDERNPGPEGSGQHGRAGHSTLRELRAVPEDENGGPQPRAGGSLGRPPVAGNDPMGGFGEDKRVIFDQPLVLSVPTPSGRPRPAGGLAKTKRVGFQPPARALRFLPHRVGIQAKSSALVLLC